MLVMKFQEGEGCVNKMVIPPFRSMDYYLLRTVERNNAFLTDTLGSVPALRAVLNSSST